MTVATPDLEATIEVIRANAPDVDHSARFPAEAVEALRRSDLLGLAVPTAYGGAGATAAEVVGVVEQVAAACASTGMVYTMHLVGSRTIAGGTTGPDDGIKAEILREIAAGRHLTTLAYSEKGSRSHFWAQVSRALPGPGASVTIDADKSWVTSAGEADSYVAATGAVGGTSPLETELYVVDSRSDGLAVPVAFDGLGMRGNASAPVTFRGVQVDVDRRLGDPGSGFGLMMSATLPWFVLSGSATSMGIAAAALATATDHVGGARLQHLGSSLADIPGVRARLAEAKIRHMQARALLYEVARQVEDGEPEARLGVLALKAAAAEMAIDVTDAAMRACGGAAFSRHLGIERNFRDARAWTVMAPTTDVLRDFVGKALLGMDLF